MSFARLCLLMLLPGVAAQTAPREAAPAPHTVPLQRVTVIDWHRAEANLTVDAEGGRLRKVTWQAPGKAGPPVVLPLARPVQDLEAALLPGSDALLLLAGGVRDGESLDLYLADRNGRFHAFATNGGARLGAEFADGLGSWPLVDGNDLMMFAYLRQGRIEFRAFDLSWSDPRSEGASVLVSRQLPASGGPGEAVRGFRAESDLDSNEVHVRFDGAGAPIDFWHPLAPRPVLPQAVMDFGRAEIGDSVERVCRVGNDGRRVLRLELAVHPPFTFLGEPVRTVEPGSQLDIRVRFAPTVGGEIHERLELRSNSGSGTLAVRLDGQCGEPAPPAAAVAAAESQPALPPPSQPAPPVAPRVTAPAELTVRSLRIEPLAGGRVVVTGLAGIADAGIDLVVGCGGGEVLAERGDGGAFRAELAAAAGGLLVATARGAGGSASKPLDLGHVLPWLRFEGDELVLCGWPDRDFTLAVAVRAGGDAQPVVWPGVWRGHLGADGMVRVPRSALGGLAQGAMVALVERATGTVRSNELSLQ